MKQRIAIIGGGAGGLAAAVSVAEYAITTGTHTEIVIFEATDRIGRPILVSGNGRCNFSNAHIDADEYWNSEFACRVLSEFERMHNPDGRPNGVVSFFERLGLVWREESEGRLYPQANKASVVLDILRTVLENLGVEIQTDARIKTVIPPKSANCRNERFALRMEDGTIEHADKVIIACGGNLNRELLPACVPVTPLQPMLGPIATENKLVRKLDNIRLRCEISLVRDGHTIATQRGEVMFRKYGVSGIAVFNLSRIARKGDTVSIRVLPDIEEQDMQDFLKRRAKHFHELTATRPTCADALRGAVLNPVADVLAEHAGIRLNSPCEDGALQALARSLNAFTLKVEGIGDVSLCQVHRGGIDVSAITYPSMQLENIPNLYAIGEALDVDGPCGGYNLHWAFATGILAGTDCAVL